MSATANPKISKDDFHIERSRFLDAFAALEEALTRLNGTLADDRILKEIKGLRLIRNDLVHAQLRLVQMEGELQAFVINSHVAAIHARQARLLKMHDFDWLAAELRRLTKNIEAA